MVAWLPLSIPASAERELDRIALTKLCGFRTLVASDPMDWLCDTAAVALFKEIAGRGMTWDVVPITSDQVLNVLKLANAVPDLKIIVDHLARPPLDSKGDPWARLVRHLAESPAVSAKVSVGMDVLAEWETWRGPDLVPYVDWACQQFGPSRLMLASNWPVVLLKNNYVAAWQDLVSAVSIVLSDKKDLEHVRRTTAQRVYNLNQQPAHRPGTLPLEQPDARTQRFEQRGSSDAD